MISDFYIRVLLPEDFEEMSRILKSSSGYWNVRTLQSCFEKHYHLWGIFFHDNLLGFVVVKENIDMWELLHIVVDKPYQTQGLAKRLMQHVFGEAKLKNMKTIQLEVGESNTKAISFYAKQGFRQVGLRKQYYANRENAILMDCIIT